MKKRKKELPWQFIVPSVSLLLYLLFGMKLIDGFFLKDVSAAHLSLAVTISTTILVGGCLLLFVENQHIEGEIVSRYHSVMRPFYHRFTQFVKVIAKFVLSINSSDDEGRKIKGEIKNMTARLCQIASRSIVSGDEPHYMQAKQIKALCENINSVWYYFDNNNDVYNHIVLDDNPMLNDNLRAMLKEYKHEMTNRNLSLHCFPSLCGDFYVKEWQPVQNVPFYYEHFMKRAEICNRYFFVSIIIEALCLILLLFSDAYGKVSTFLCDILVLTSLFSFLVCLYKFQKLKFKSVITAF